MKFVLHIFLITSVCLALTAFAQVADYSFLPPVHFLLMDKKGTVVCLDNDNDTYFSNEGCGTAVDCNDNEQLIHPGAVDLPDNNFVDLNCDGIDGDREKAVFIDTVSGSDANSGISSDSPMQSVQAGIQKVSNTVGRDYLLVSVGQYIENDLELVSGVSIYGGYSAATGWERSDAIVNYPVIYGGTRGISADGVSNVSLDLLRIISADNTLAGGSSYGIFLKDSINVSVTRCIVVAGNGGSGEHGSAGLNGSKGGNGSSGNPGCENSSMYCDSCSQPTGGAGGMSSCGSGGGSGGAPGHASGNGNVGAKGSGFTGGIGGSGGTTQNTCGEGLYSCYCIDTLSDVSGGNGGAGQNGSNGVGGILFGTMIAAGYSTSNGDGGTMGGNGSGGGGGGGGKGGDDVCDSYGSSGGGGGAGGCAGTSGKGGKGGGGSFALWLYNCEAVTISDNSITSGSGGNAGNGGKGGTGGTGGDGGAGGAHGGSSEQDDGGCGGFGGDGGNGGNGGHGGGGGGGPSIGIVMNTATVTLTGNSFFVGYGGNGGSSDGYTGAGGMTGNTYTISQ